MIVVYNLLSNTYALLLYVTATSTICSQPNINHFLIACGCAVGLFFVSFTCMLFCSDSIDTYAIWPQAIPTALTKFTFCLYMVLLYECDTMLYSMLLGYVLLELIPNNGTLTLHMILYIACSCFTYSTAANMHDNVYVKYITCGIIILQVICVCLYKCVHIKQSTGTEFKYVAVASLGLSLSLMIMLLLQSRTNCLFNTTVYAICISSTLFYSVLLCINDIRYS